MVLMKMQIRSPKYKTRSKKWMRLDKIKFDAVIYLFNKYLSQK